MNTPLETITQTVVKVVKKQPAKEKQKFLADFFLELSTAFPGTLFGDSFREMEKVWKEQREQIRGRKEKIIPQLTSSEEKVLIKIKRTIGKDYTSYSFQFTYNENKEAVNWNGGFDISREGQSQNQYTIMPGRRLWQNWE